MRPLRPLAIAASLVLALTAKPAFGTPINILHDDDAGLITWPELLAACGELDRSRELCEAQGMGDRSRAHREDDLFLVSLFTGSSGVRWTVRAEPSLAAAAHLPLQGEVVVTPEPSSLLLLATGLALVIRQRRSGRQ